MLGVALNFPWEHHLEVCGLDLSPARVRGILRPERRGQTDRERNPPCHAVILWTGTREKWFHVSGPDGGDGGLSCGIVPRFRAFAMANCNANEIK
jgi:hypothetical protein